MSGEILIVPEHLRGMRTKVRHAAMELGAGSQIPRVDLSHSPRVHEEFRELAGRWDEKRNEIIDGMDGVAEVLKAIADAFETADQQLTNALTGEGG